MGRVLAVLMVLALASCDSSSRVGSGSGEPAAGAGGVVEPTTPSRMHPASTPSQSTVAAGSIGEVDHGSRTRRWVALTFDADMTREMLARLRSGAQRSWYDAAIVRELEATRTPATIFLTGLWTQAYAGVVRGLAHNPLFELENHSVDHSGWLAPCYGLPVVRSALSKQAEIEQAGAIIHRVAGITPRYFRFPGGCHDEADLRLVASAGERAVDWDVVSGDAFEPDPELIVRNVLDGVRPGSIVIMHLVGTPNAPATYRALPTIISALRTRGYRLVTVRQLLATR